MKMRKWAAIMIAGMMVMTVAGHAAGEGAANAGEGQMAGFQRTGVAQEDADRIWQRGDQGEDVRSMQEKLIALGYLEEGKASGSYDEAMETAVLMFQEDHGLLATGMADRITREAIMAETRPRAAREESVTEKNTEIYYAASATAMPMESGEIYADVDWFVSDGVPAMAAGAWASEGDWYNTEEYTQFESNRFLNAGLQPLSTFAADVDTSSYALLRRKILAGEGIDPSGVRVEEMLNYFRYDYAEPTGTEPFGVTIGYGPCPWNQETRLLQIGLQAMSVQEAERPAHNLVFLIDTSGSMVGDDRLGLVKRAFLMLLEELKETDTVSIVTYASADRVVLEGVPAGEKTRIMEAINDLEAWGSTNGSAGLTRAYEIAEKYRQEGGVNRILLATDGDLNVGVSSEGALARLVTEKKVGGVSLTCLGFGMGNYKDNKMEALADYGDGNCWYIDTIHEARKALVTEAGGTFITVAKDVKLQADFNPAYVEAYRLIGYEDRLMAAEDFANDEKDGGEIGSGHQVTALYEIVPAGSGFDYGKVESRYQTEVRGEENGELLTVAIRAKEPEGTESRLYEVPVSTEAYREELDDNMKFAAAVAETAMVLRDSEWKGETTYGSALTLLRSCGSVSGDPYREEFVYLVGLLERGE